MIKTAFINYRRDDSGPEAKLIANALSQSLSPEAVFLDTDRIDLGEEWPQRIRSALDGSQYVIVVIGPKWLHAGMDQWGRRRIDNESDWVRQEILHALRDEKKTVIPVLIDGAEMPPPEVLPDDMALVTSKQAIVIRRDNWDHDIKLLTAKMVPDAEIDQLGDMNPLLKPIWSHVDDDLRQILVIAATLAQLEGKNYVSTTNFVKSLMVLEPGRISDFFGKLPGGALPDSIPEDIPVQLSALQSLDSFSPCINSAISNLTPEVLPQDKISSEDVYIDIARYATGKSTQRLRSHGVNKTDVENIVKQLGWHLVERKTVIAE